LELIRGAVLPGIQALADRVATASDALTTASDAVTGR
jgi:hypothetical protein